MGRVISRGPKNYLAWDELIDTNPPWATARSNIPSTNNPSPDDRSTASILHEDGTGASTHYLTYGVGGAGLVDIGYGNLFCYYAFAKPINRNWLRLYIVNPGLVSEAYFDVQNGVVGTTAGTVDSVGIIPKNDGWYLCYIGTRYAAEALITPQIYVSPSNGVFSFNGLNQDSLYLWRPQINSGLIPGESVLTGEVPRT